MAKCVSSARKASTCVLLGLFTTLALLVIARVQAQDVPPANCPPTINLPCCSPTTTTTSQTWPPGVNVNVNIDPSFNQLQRDAIVRSFQNWQAAGGLANNGSGVTFTFTFNANAPTMNPPPGTYNAQVWDRDPPRNTGLAGDTSVTRSNGRVVSQETWINTQTTDECAVAQTAAHETGHAFGLDHPSSPCGSNPSVMNTSTAGYNSLTGTYGPTVCDNGEVNQVAQYPTPTPTPTPTPVDCSQEQWENCYINANCYDLYPYPNCGQKIFHSTPDPVLIDVSGNGFALTSAANGVRFDLDADGYVELCAWTSSTDDAFLVLDRNSNGTIDNGIELFGDITPQIPSENPNGFLALAEFDKLETGGNGDGLITGADSIFSSLRLWLDSNHNGVSESGELHTITGLGLKSLELDYKISKKTDQYGNQFRYRAKVKDIRGHQLARWAWNVFLLSQQ